MSEVPGGACTGYSWCLPTQLWSPGCSLHTHLEQGSLRARGLGFREADSKRAMK